MDDPTAAAVPATPPGGRVPRPGPRPTPAPPTAAGEATTVRADPGARDGDGGAGPGDDGPRPLGIGVHPTGHQAVDAALARLADADHLAVPGHLEVYEDVHRGLRDTLAALDRAPGPTPDGAPHRPHHPRS
ncbi:hypothetical protein [Streptomyces otsuchiensis]|uniref:hypothetical protein n=1 Tax=Streptomyces otsuchiensis TaxID=2681388 RepID=UPI001030F5EC|nr:hypothetical protein [Streptomyces otsuchiensis]